MPFLYDVLNVKLQLHIKGLSWSKGVGGGEAPQKLFFISYMFISRNRVFNSHFNRYLSNVENLFADCSRAEPILPLP